MIPGMQHKKALLALALGAVLGVSAFAAEETNEPDEDSVAGYTVVEKDGVKRYCRKRANTGSHVRREKTCLTRDELDELRARTQDWLRNNARQAPPPQDKPGPGG